jgi:hypothetical protein
MSSVALEEIQQDQFAMSVARAIAVANEEAASRGIDLAKSLVTISEATPPPTRSWQVHYGPRDFSQRRGGDLIVIVDGDSGNVRSIQRGQ